MRARQFIVEGAEENANVVEMFQKFLPLAMEILEIDRLPKMEFAPDLNTGKQPSFGAYVPGENMLLVALKNRHPVDILRTVAHELVHYKQDQQGELTDTSGETGSPHENQAHEIAGVIMRNFNKRYPNYLRSKPL
jgi:Zn-dependent peptidase ImmA (M78 family)